jgi:hypothetical protein
MQRTRRLALLVAVLVLSAGAAASGKSSGLNDQLACALVSHADLVHVFGLPKVEQHLTVTSPTSSQPGYQHTVEGSDQSECSLYVFRKKPSAATLKRLVQSPGKLKPPPGIALVLITTNVRDADPNGDGDTWDPDSFFGDSFTAMNGLAKHFGGAHFAVPSFGTSSDWSVWIGNKNHAAAIWETKDSVVQLNVVVGGGVAPARLVAVAKIAVPTFASLAP